jgi:riboflavin kinase/FMN adenylyltransferase
MNIYRHLSELPVTPGPVVATIGNFDGVHLGHQGVIAEVIERARFLGGQSIAITFDPHPSRVLRPEAPTKLITPTRRKLELLAATGLDATLVLPFTQELCHTSARDFAAKVLVDAIHITEIHEGDNFRFGYHAEAGIEGLDALGRELGFHTVIYAPRNFRGRAVSSSRVRDLLAKGDVSAARALLAQPFAIDSTPASGRGYGTKYTVPTINLAPYPELLPANGVYITTLRIGDERTAETFEAVTNVGNRPTFGADSFAVESHLLNFHPVDLTGSTPLRLTFLRRLRAEQHFPSTEALRDQIRMDVTRARRYFDLCRVRELTS